MESGLKPQQIAELLRPFIELKEEQASNTLTYINLILKWNARINLTSVRRPEEIVTRHFGESFFAAATLLGAEQPASVIDLGSGAGFPGLPLAMLAVQARVTLIEASGKKAAFLNEVIRTLGLGNVAVFNGRGEDYGAKVKLVTMRAVEKFDAAMVLAAEMVDPGGRLALMIGKGQVEKAKESGCDLIWGKAIDVPGGHSRVLLVGTRKELP